MHRRSRVALGLLAGAVLAACLESEVRIPADRLHDLVLQPSDLPAYSQFAFGAQASADAHPGPRKDAARFGRVGGWIARYRPVDPAARERPLVIESRSDLFAAASGAAQDLDAYRGEYRALVRTAGGRELDPPSVGAEACAFTYGAASDVFVVVAWRSANATASVLIEGVSPTIEQALDLARTQQAHVEAAAR